MCFPRADSIETLVDNELPLVAYSGVSAFLLAHMPLAMDLLGFQGATPMSGTAMLGVSAFSL